MVDTKIKDLTSRTPAVGDQIPINDISGPDADGQVTVGACLDLVAGDVNVDATAVSTIPNDTVTYAKMQNIATDRLIGRDTAATGDPEEISLNSTLEFTGAGAVQRAALTGDVTSSAGSNTTAIASGVIVDGDVNTSAAIAVTKIANGTADQIVKTNSGGTALEHGKAGIANLSATGTPDSTTFLRGDNTWSAPAGSGDMVLASVQTVTGAKTFGTIGGAVGKLILAGSTSGSTIVNTEAVAGSTTATIPAATDTLVGKATTDILTNKTIDADGTGNVLTNIDEGNCLSTSDLLINTITFIIDGGGSVITTGVKGFLEIPFNCTINRVTLLADQSGSIVVDIWKDTYANYPPTVADTITASAKPTISTATKAQDSTLTGWTTSIAAGDILGFNVDSITTCQRVTLSLKVTKT